MFRRRNKASAHARNSTRASQMVRTSDGLSLQIRKLVQVYHVDDKRPLILAEVTLAEVTLKNFPFSKGSIA